MHLIQQLTAERSYRQVNMMLSDYGYHKTILSQLSAPLQSLIYFSINFVNKCLELSIDQCIWNKYFIYPITRRVSDVN
jgi:hypothetical protein